MTKLNVAYHYILVTCTGLFFCTKSAFAYFYLDTSGLLESSMQIEHAKTEFQFDTFSTTASQDRISINWYEPFTSNFHGGVELGYMDLSLGQSSLFSPVFASGRYGGLLFRFIPVQQPLFDLSFLLHYRYNSTKSSGTSPQVEIIWHESRFSTTLGLHLGKKTTIDISGDYRIIDGEQRIIGSTLEEFNEATREGFRLGISYKINRSGFIKLEGLGGYQQGARMTFSRYF